MIVIEWSLFRLSSYDMKSDGYLIEECLVLALLDVSILREGRVKDELLVERY
jgi:hypothetical protein